MKFKWFSALCYLFNLICFFYISFFSNVTVDTKNLAALIMLGTVTIVTHIGSRDDD